MPFAEADVYADKRPFDFVVPPELEAREPAEVRGASREDVRLLVTDQVRGITHSRFERLVDFLSPGDLLVLNDSKTFPAALRAERQSGESVTLHIAARSRLDTTLVEPRNASLTAGERLKLPGGGEALILSSYRESRRMWTAQLALPLPFFSYFARFGKPIAYRHITREWPIESFQTVYARVLGSAEMPSAGRPITCEMLDRLKARGVKVATVTLHCGVSSPERDEPPFEEWREVSAETAVAVRQAKMNKGRVVAVGTTVVRALESSLDAQHRIIASRGWTNLYITAARGVRVVDGVLTGFHEATSTHLAILESIGGRAHVQSAYEAALEGRYLWHEFGDSHLMLLERNRSEQALGRS